MKGKPGVSQTALSMIPMVGFLMMFGCTDCLQSILYLLANEDFYDLDLVDRKNVASDSASYGTFFSIPVLLIIGVIYETVGRKFTISFCYFMCGTCTILYVAGSPSVFMFSMVRTVFQCFLTPILCVPLINDYVQVQYRGRATALLNQGQIAGNLLSVAVLFTLT
jgi:hypothetical protein